MGLPIIGIFALGIGMMNEGAETHAAAVIRTNEIISWAMVGIDGLVEQVKDGEVTARWISTQIKSGVSYFSESGWDGVVFTSADDVRRALRQRGLPV